GRAHRQGPAGPPQRRHPRDRPRAAQRRTGHGEGTRRRAAADRAGAGHARTTRLLHALPRRRPGRALGRALGAGDPVTAARFAIGLGAVALLSSWTGWGGIG